MNQPTDTDATGAFVVGTGRSDQAPRNILDIQPNWIADGYGVRGPQRPVQQERASPTPMDFAPATTSSRGPDSAPGGGCAPTTPPASGTHVWGTVDGVCQWIGTCPDECPPV